MTGAAVKSTLALGFEGASNGSSNGRQLLFGPAVVALSQSLTTQPTVNATATQGMRLLIIVQGLSAGAAATITVAGKKPDGITAVSEATTNISLATADSNGLYYYVTKAVYGSVNASGVTASSISGALANALVTIYGITSAKWLVPCEFKVTPDYTIESPADNRGLYDEDVRMLQLDKHVTWEASGNYYPEDDEWFLLGGIANVTTPSTPASIPASPTSLMAATAFSSLSTPFNVTTQPSYPGMQLVFTVAGGNALAGTISITGTDRWGNTLSEVVSIPGTNGTFYSFYTYNAFTSTSFSISGFTGTATLAIGGVFSFNKIYLPTDALQILCGEHFDGVASAVLPYMGMEEWSLEYDVKSAMKFSAKGFAQEYLAVGDLTQSTMNTNQFGPYPQPIDFPVQSWPGAFYIDSLGGTPGTTSAFGVFDIITLKVTGTTGLVPYWIATQNQLFGRVGRKRRKTAWEAEIDFVNYTAYRQYEAFTKGLFTAQFRAEPYIGNNAGALVRKQLQLVLPSRRVKFTREGSEEKVVGKVSGTCEYEPSLGYSFQASIINQNNPNYAL
jgi:hypothetical protein